MILDVDQGFVKPCRLFDAEGNHIPDVVRCDTETGEVTQLARDEDGRLRPKNGELSRVTKTYPAPLRTEPIPQRTETA